MKKAKTVNSDLRDKLQREKGNRELHTKINIELISKLLSFYGFKLN